MSEQPTIDASQELINLVFTALANAINTVREVQPFSPLALIVDSKDEPTPVLFAAETTEEAIRRGYGYIAGLGEDVVMYALAMDIFMTIDGQRFEAILVEAGERGKPFALQFAQRYHPRTGDTEFETIGNPAYIGQTEQRLGS